MGIPQISYVKLRFSSLPWQDKRLREYRFKHLLACLKGEVFAPEFERAQTARRFVSFEPDYCLGQAIIAIADPTELDLWALRGWPGVDPLQVSVITGQEALCA